MSWLEALPAFLVTIAVLVVPGAAITVAFGVRGVTAVVLTPLASVSVIGLTTLLGTVLPLPWSALPIVIMTILLCAIIVGLRLLLRRHWSMGPVVRDGRRYGWAFTAAAVAAFLLVAWRVIDAFGQPGNISQTFDNIYHLNAVRYILDTGDASPLHIASLTWNVDHISAYYPDTWHALVATVAQLSGAAIPVAVNAANIAIAALIWPLGCLLLSRVILGNRPIAVLAAGVLSAAFGVFPLRMLDFGVLYPNLLSISLLPGVLAIVAAGFGLGIRPAQSPLVRWLLVAAAVPGLALAHPSTLVALLGFTVPIAAVAGVRLVGRMRAAHAKPLDYVVRGLIAAVVFAGAALLFVKARPASELAFWQPWQNTPKAFWSAVSSSMQNMPVDWVIVVFTVLGIVGAFVMKRGRWVVFSYAIAVFLYVVVSSFPDSMFRYLFTGTWYSDSNRLAALIPAVALPVAAIGVVWLYDLIGALLVRFGMRSAPAPAGSTDAAAVVDDAAHSGPATRRPTTPVRAVVGAVLLVAITLATQLGAPLAAASASARGAYAAGEQAPVLSNDEMELLSRLDDKVPAGVVVAGSPWTGASLVYAYADRSALLPAIFGDRSVDTVAIMEGLRNADADPMVCDALRDTNTWYVLDFGPREVHNGEHVFSGFADLEDSGAVKLVDEEGDARLYEVTACQ
ncbi:MULTISPECIES: DUF6541 family protein [unclassified Leifsonia]|uniref:DUF6541 family protein n=1 Tax=unclassified Leifsonia TaxID=2663824 RepID=UPI0006F9C376|nr:MULTISPECIES: DUF6541 family protein [unclassified Leifsonia]KQX06403.1 hypothetical protein ASC59_00530 [Leifsonia sp. Root1293]KRA10686.1 hypothetical protein ASD61_00530 [Leifsonia sp. Root60]